MKEVDILGVKIDKLTSVDALKRVGDFLDSEKKDYIVTVNPEFIMAAYEDEYFEGILNNADLAIADGIGLLWAGKYLSWKSGIYNKFALRIVEFFKIIVSGSSLVFYPKFCREILPERIAGVDMIWKIAKLCEQKSCSIFLLGGFDGVGEATAKRLRQEYPNLKIAGFFEGSAKKEGDKKIRDVINSKKPDVIFVAFGHVKQERWIARNINYLENVKLAMGVGGSFDFISGKAKRASRFFQYFGIEWLYRVFKEPWRFGRIMTATWKFVWTVYRYKINNIINT